MNFFEWSFIFSTQQYFDPNNTIQNYIFDSNIRVTDLYFLKERNDILKPNWKLEYFDSNNIIQNYIIDSKIRITDLYFSKKKRIDILKANGNFCIE